MTPRACSMFGSIVLACVTSSTIAQDADSRVIVHIVKPSQVEPTDERVEKLKLPSGFRIAKFAEGLGNPRMMAIADDGSVYVTRRTQGDVLRLVDADGDGKAESRDTVLERKGVHGICIHQSRVYLATVKDIAVCDISSDGRFGQPTVLARDLPDGAQHPNRTIAVGPDRALYCSIGSSCNACVETNEEHATMLRFALDGSGRSIFCTGLRNTLGFAWQPGTGDLYGADHGIDDLGDDTQKEELNLIVRGRNYGWPYIYEDGQFNPVPPLLPGMTKEQLISGNTAPVLTFTAHAAPMNLVFIPESSAWPKEYSGDALVSLRGSWNRKPPSGYEVVRVRFKNGKPDKVEDFLSGFLMQNGKSHFGRPVGLAFARDGSLLISDDTCGVIYRVWRARDGEPDRASGPRIGG